MKKYPDKNARSEQKLWASVVAQAVKDAYDFTASTLRTDRESAIQWLFTPSDDLDIVFERAGYDPVGALPRIAQLIVARAQLSAQELRPYIEGGEIEFVQAQRAEISRAREFLESEVYRCFLSHVIIDDLRQVVASALLPLVPPSAPPPDREWRPIPGFEGYRLSPCCAVWSEKHRRFLDINSRGMVTLSDGDRSRTRSVLKLKRQIYG